MQSFFLILANGRINNVWVTSPFCVQHSEDYLLFKLIYLRYLELCFVQKLSDESLSFVVIWIISQDIFALLRSSALPINSCQEWERAVSLIEIYYNWVYRVLPFFVLEDISLWWLLWYTLMFSNLVCCIVYFSILIPCIYEKILSPILLHILKPTNEGSWVPQKFFFLNF